MQASGALSRMARSSTGEHFCQSKLQGTVKNRSLVAGGVPFYILLCQKDIPLQTPEYSLQVGGGLVHSVNKLITICSAFVT